MKIGYIYLIIHRDSGSLYVGQTVNPKKRWLEHYRNLNKHQHRNPILQNAWNKYGGSAFEFKIAEEVMTDLTISEQYWIDAYRASGVKVYNIAEAGDPPDNRGVKRSEEFKANVGNHSRGNKHALGYRHTEEARSKISAAGIGHKRNVGKKMSEEQKMKISIANTGRECSKETRKKISEKAIGHTRTKGIKRSDEFKAKIKASWIIRKQKKV